MDIQYWDIAALREDPRNARKHGTRNLDTIKASLAAFGQRRAAVVRADGTVLAGNGMLAAAKELGWEQLAVTVVPDAWSDDQARAYSLADNRTSELAEWDVAVLDEHIVELTVAGLDVEALGFDAPQPLDEMPHLSDADRSEFEQITFTLHRDQAQVVRDAVAVAKDMGPFVDSENQNANGNGIARVCELWLGEYGDGIR